MKLLEWSTTGFLFATFCVETAASFICWYNTDADTADCRNKGLNKIPSNIKRSIQHLDLSSNPLKLTENFFENLTSLITLKMRYLNLRSPSANDFALHHLKKLEFLDLTGSQFDEDFNFIWPNSTKTLIIDNIPGKIFDLRGLENLERLSAKNCSLESFPYCFIYAPLVCVDLTDNPVDDLHVNQLSNYCLLEKLFIKYPATGSSLKTKESFCQCLELSKWSERYSVSNMNLECYKGIDTNCQIDFTEDVKKIDECMKRIVYEWKSTMFGVILGTLAALALFMMMYVIYRKCIAPFLPTEENKPSTTRRPLTPTPKPWKRFSLPLRFPATPPPQLPGEEIEEEEEADEEEDSDD